ncbi:hypothetical protein [Umezawaea tangerina]|uniref:Polyketide cyclase/dehydrase/lipid transport protein n=1 Tax=Umezawaea tangerina TaxID=84725 RepID=A0A2T0STW8_9PSEU|nr:hypothetical protein [Umezawaea tangerina]PRY36859.1 hypothetical protein CLV43_111231 [Umezawaea tangerina]
MRYVAQAVLDAPVERVDLAEWLFTLTDAEYRAAARGHHAAGVSVDDRGRGTVNVESVGGNLLVQHYRAERADPAFVEMYSATTRAYLYHLVPLTCRVRWILEAEAGDERSSVFSCTVDVDLPLPLRVLARVTAMPFFLRRHLVEETAGFAADINRKLALARAA